MQSKTQTIYQYFKEHGSFFHDKANRVYVLFEGKVFEVSDNPSFNELITRLKLISD